MQRDKEEWRTTTDTLPSDKREFSGVPGLEEEEQYPILWWRLAVVCVVVLVLGWAIMR